MKLWPFAKNKPLAPPVPVEAAAALSRMAGPDHHRTQTPISNADNRRMMRGRFEMGFTTPDNAQMWGLADGMSPDAQASWMIRRTLRMRSRQAYEHNNYYRHMVATQANYVVGTGPRLQVATQDRKFNTDAEAAFSSWAAAINLPKKLRSMRRAQNYNGEAFALLRTNPKIRNPVKLDVFEIEADQVSSPYFGQYPAQYPDQYFDGKMLDPWGNPLVYHVLRQHPGAFGAFVVMGYEFDPWPAQSVIQSYRVWRPGAQRGIPEMLPAIPLLEEIRVFMAATRTAAESAAQVAIVMASEAPTVGLDPNATCEPYDVIQMDRGQSWTAPYGYKPYQIKAEHPNAQLEQFVNMNLREAAAVSDMPLWMVSMDASGVNMSSAYVLTQPFVKSVQVDREEMQSWMSAQVFTEFMKEWTRVAGYVPGAIPPIEEIAHSWRWPRIGHHADPSKTASAAETRLAMGISSGPDEVAEDGGDWEERQAADARFLGMDIEDYRAALRERRFAAKGNPQAATEVPEPDESDAPVPSTQPSDGGDD